MRKIRRRLRRGRPEVKFLNVMLLVIAVALIIVGVSRLGSENRAESTEVLAKHVERTTTTVPRTTTTTTRRAAATDGKLRAGRNDRDDCSEPEAEVEASPRNHDDHRSVPRGRVGNRRLGAILDPRAAADDAADSDHARGPRRRRPRRARRRPPRPRRRCLIRCRNRRRPRGSGPRDRLRRRCASGRARSSWRRTWRGRRGRAGDRRSRAPRPTRCRCWR